MDVVFSRRRENGVRRRLQDCHFEVGVLAVAATADSTDAWPSAISSRGAREGRRNSGTKAHGFTRSVDRDGTPRDRAVDGLMGDDPNEAGAAEFALLPFAVALPSDSHRLAASMKAAFSALRASNRRLIRSAATALTRWDRHWPT